MESQRVPTIIHGIWLSAFVNDFESRDEDFDVFRHYARTGEELAEALPWSQIAGDNDPYTALQPIEGGRRLFSASDRVGFIAPWGIGEDRSGSR